MWSEVRQPATPGRPDPVLLADQERATYASSSPARPPSQRLRQPVAPFDASPIIVPPRAPRECWLVRGDQVERAEAVWDTPQQGWRVELGHTPERSVYFPRRGRNLLEQEDGDRPEGQVAKKGKALRGGSTVRRPGRSLRPAPRG
jgi:hypothetical protein